MMSSVQYQKIDDQGLHLQIGDHVQILNVDNVIICAGQESNKNLQDPLIRRGVEVHLIGGAQEARELDAKHAIKQGMELALKIETEG